MEHWHRENRLNQQRKKLLLYSFAMVTFSTKRQIHTLLHNPAATRCSTSSCLSVTLICQNDGRPSDFFHHCHRKYSVNATSPFMLLSLPTHYGEWTASKLYLLFDGDSQVINCAVRQSNLGRSTHSAWPLSPPKEPPLWALCPSGFSPRALNRLLYMTVLPSYRVLFVFVVKIKNSKFLVLFLFAAPRFTE